MAAEFNAELDSVIRSAFQAQGVRLDPNAKTSEIAEQLQSKYQITASVDHGALKLEQNGLTISNGTALKALTEREPQHFILNGGQVRSLSDFKTTEQKVEHIRQHGLDSFSKLVTAPNLRPGIVAPREMSRADWSNLTRSEKSAAIALDPQIVSIVMSKKA